MKAKKNLFKLQHDRHRAKNINRADEFKPKQRTVYNYKCGQKSLRLVVEKLEVAKPALNEVFYHTCTACGKEFEGPLETCPDCGGALIKLNLRKCPKCQAKNMPARASCWVCGALFEQPPVQEKEIRLNLILSMDGIFYRNNDPGLSPRMKQLFEELASSGFNRAPLEAWIKERPDEEEAKKELFREKVKAAIRPSDNSNDFILVLGIAALVVLLIILSLVLRK